MEGPQSHRSILVSRALPLSHVGLALAGTDMSIVSVFYIRIDKSERQIIVILIVLTRFHMNFLSHRHNRIGYSQYNYCHYHTQWQSLVCDFGILFDLR